MVLKTLDSFLNRVWFWLKASKETKENKIDFHLAAFRCPMLFACFTFGSLSGFIFFILGFGLQLSVRMVFMRTQMYANEIIDLFLVSICFWRVWKTWNQIIFDPKGSPHAKINENRNVNFGIWKMWTVDHISTCIFIFVLFRLFVLVSFALCPRSTSANLNLIKLIMIVNGANCAMINFGWVRIRTRNPPPSKKFVESGDSDKLTDQSGP